MAATTLSLEARVHGIHHQHAVFADLDGDVAARADQHVDVALHGKNVDFDFVEVLLLLRVTRGTCQRGCKDGDFEIHKCLFVRIGRPAP